MRMLAKLNEPYRSIPSNLLMKSESGAIVASKFFEENENVRVPLLNRTRW